MKKCTSCGSIAKSDWLYCPQCGGSQNKDTPPQKTAIKSNTLPKYAVLWTILTAIAIVAITLYTNTSNLDQSPIQKTESFSERLEEAQKLLESSSFDAAENIIAGLPKNLSESDRAALNSLKAEYALKAAKNRISGTIPATATPEDQLGALVQSYTEFNRLYGSHLSSQHLFEQEAIRIVHPLPASELELNAKGYEFLSQINSSEQTYAKKAADYRKGIAEAKAASIAAKKAAIDRAENNILGKYRSQRDNFTKTTFYTHRSSPPYLNSRSTTYLYIGKDESSVWLRLKTTYTADSWLFVEKVSVLIDGEPELLTSGRFDRDNHSKIWEWMDERPSDRQLSTLKRMGQAKSVILRYEGSKYRKDVTLNANDKAAIKDVLNDIESLRKIQAEKRLVQ